MNKNLTDKEYWESSYQDRSEIEPISICGFKNHCTREILNKKIEPLEEATTVLELGGGASRWLAYFSREYPEKWFMSIDYSAEGGEKLREFVRRSNATNIEVVVDDFFSKSSLYDRFDFVYSHGVVEHFTDLSEVLVAHSRYLSPNGKMLTIIPNLAGILGLLTRAFNRDVYDIHIPHDLIALRNGHTAAGLSVVESGYLCSNNFGVLSSCVRYKRGVRWHIYKFLSRVSKLVWLFEDKVVGLPATRLFSPYIYVLSERSSHA